MLNIKKHGFTDEDDEWRFEEYFSGVEEFMDSGQHAVRGTVDVDIEMYNDDTDFKKPQGFQEKALNYFHENQDVVFSAMCQGVIDQLPELIKIYGTKLIPDLKTAAEVKDHVSICVIQVLAAEKDGFGYIGFNCNCTWDDEHGVGIVMHKDRVIDIGDGDTSYMSHEPILKDQMTEEEWTIYKTEKEKRIAENIANSIRESEEAAQRELAEKKKWWKFWG